MVIDGPRWKPCSSGFGWLCLYSSDFGWFEVLHQPKLNSFHWEHVLKVIRFKIVNGVIALGQVLPGNRTSFITLVGLKIISEMW